MKKIYVLIFILVTLNLSGFCQTAGDSIEIKKSSGNFSRQVSKSQTPEQLMFLVKDNPEAYKLMRQAKANYGAAKIFSYVGGFFIGYPLGTAIAGGKPSWALMGVGAGVLVASVPFHVAYVKRSTKAVEVYNQTSLTDNTRMLKINMQVSGKGLALNLQF